MTIFIEELRKAVLILRSMRDEPKDTAEVARRCHLPIHEVNSWNKLLNLGLEQPNNNGFVNFTRARSGMYREMTFKGSREFKQ